jgi:hypothetical protein
MVGREEEGDHFLVAEVGLLKELIAIVVELDDVVRELELVKWPSQSAVLNWERFHDPITAQHARQKHRPQPEEFGQSRKQKPEHSSEARELTPHHNKVLTAITLTSRTGVYSPLFSLVRSGPHHRPLRLDSTPHQRPVPKVG